jgi:hypothetical protein
MTLFCLTNSAVRQLLGGKGIEGRKDIRYKDRKEIILH